MARARQTTWIARTAGVGLAGVMALSMGTGAEQMSKLAEGADGKLAEQVKPIAGKDHAVGSPDPMKEPLALIAKAKAAYAKVRDYSCTLVKRERIDGKLTPNHIIVLKMRTSPFSVSMCWQEPGSMKGQEVCFVAGRNNNEMRVKPAGLLGALGFVSLSPDDERVRETSQHRITDAGVGRLIEQCSEGWPRERTLKVTTVRIGTFQYAKRRCTRVELTHAGNADGKLRNHRNVVYFDQQTHLPIRVENYDWPKTPGQPGELVEMFSYLNLCINVDLPDEAFNR